MPASRFTKLLIVVLALAAGGAHAGQNAWTLHGPVNGAGAVRSVATHPADGSIALVGTPRGIFRTTDVGTTWTLVADGVTAVPIGIVFDASNPDHVVATDGTLHLSTNGGLTFAPLASPAGAGYVGVVNFAPDGTLYAFTATGRLYRAAAPFTNWTEIARGWNDSYAHFVTIDPADPQILYVGLYGQGIYQSVDAGAHWSPINYGLNWNSTQSFTALSVDPTDSARLVAAVGNDIYLSTDSGASWTPMYGHWATWVGFDPEDSSMVYAIGFNNEIYRSQQGGDNWTTWANLRLAGVNGIGFTAGSHGNLFIATSNGVIHTSGGAFLSVDYRNNGLTGVSASQLAVSQNTVYAAMSAGFHDFYRRNNSDYVPVDDIFSTHATTYRRFISSLAAAPSDSSQLFAINDFHELIRSIDSGAHWTGPHAAFQPGPGINTDILNHVAIDPNDPQVAYVSRKLTGVWKTIDGGSNFAPLPNSPPDTGLVGISPHDGDVLYAAVSRSGIAKSVDGGDTWIEQLAPAPGLPRVVKSFTFHPTNPNEVYAPTGDDGLFRTTDGGTSWHRVSLPQTAGPTWAANAVLIDPVKPSTVWVFGGRELGFWRSVDSGLNWETTGRPVPPGTIISGESAVFDPADPTTLLATFSGAGIGEYHLVTDVGVTLVASPTMPFPTSSTVNATFRVSNLGPHASSSAELRIDVPSWITPSAPGCTFAAPRLSCTINALRVGEVRDVSVAFAVGATPQPSGGVNVYLIAYEEDDNGVNNYSGFGGSAEEYADVDVSIGSGTQTLDPGVSTNVTVNVSNSGPSPSTATQLTLYFPANMSASNIGASSGSCTAGSGTAVCNLGTLAANTSANVSFSLRGNTAGPGTLTASASGAGFDPDGTHTATRDFTVRQLADLSVSLAESADPVTVGTPFQYMATVANYGGDAGTFTLSIPVAGVTVTSVATDFGTCSTSSNTVTCTASGLAAWATGTVTVAVVPTVQGIATASATVTHSGTDSNLANNSATIGTNVRLVGDISVEIVDSMDPASAGAPFTYTVTARNAGPNAGTVHLYFSMPVSGASLSVPGSCTILGTPAVTCTITSLASGASATATFNVQTPTPGDISATVSAVFDGFDPDTSNNSATAQTEVRSVNDVGVTIAESADPITAGSVLSYVVSVTNAGPSEASVHLTIPVTGGTVTGATPSQGGTCTIAGGTVTCDFNPLSFSPSTVDLVLNSTTAGTVTATVTTTSSGTDPISANNTATASTTVNAASSSSSSSGGGGGGGSGGGGGRFDWLALLLLGGVLVGRARLRVPALR